jgi:hypothetical protein
LADPDPNKNLNADPDPDNTKMLRSFRNIDRKHLGLHPALYVPQILSKLCHILPSVSIFVKICLKKSLGFLLSVGICPQLNPNPGGKSFADPDPKHC